MKNIIVTGGAGYIGSIVCKDLINDGYAVTCIDSFKFGNESLDEIQNHKNFNKINLDINNFSEVESVLSNKKYFAIIHLAAIVGDPACKIYSDEAKNTNLISSIKLYELAIKYDVQKFLFSSTCSNYGKMKNKEVNEDSDLAPVSLYAELKVEFEKYILKSINKTKKLSPCILRFSTVYGSSPRMRFDLTVNEFTKDLYLGRELEVFGNNLWRPYCHVKDFSNVFLRMLKLEDSKIKFNIFNVGSSSENYTKQMLVNILLEKIPNAKIKYVKQIDDLRDYKVNFDKIKKEIGFTPSIIVAEGIQEILNNLKNNIYIDPDHQKHYNIPIKEKN